MISWNFFFETVLNGSLWDHVISIFGSNLTIAASGKMVTDYRHVLWQNRSDFEEIMASKVGVPPLESQISKELSMLKVKY